jgi:hypothetical protein
VGIQGGVFQMQGERSLMGAAVMPVLTGLAVVRIEELQP